MELGRLCSSLNCRPDTFSFAFVSTDTLLHAHIKSDNTALLLQLLTISPGSMYVLQYPRCGINGLEFLLKGDFDKPWALMNVMITEVMVRPPASGGAEGHWLAGPSGHHCGVVMLPRVLRGAGLTPLV